MRRNFEKLMVFGAILVSGVAAMGCSDAPATTSGSSTSSSSSGASSSSSGGGEGGAGGEAGSSVGGAGGAGGAGGGMMMVCKPGEAQDCYSGPAGTDGVGICKKGTQTCLDDGSGFGACMGEIVPAPETCNTMEDDDCDGMANEEGDGCVCVPGSMTACYTGPMNTEGVGICKAGMQTCKADGTGYEACIGEVLPDLETCNTAEDDDCDGMVNEEGVGCACAPNSSAPCYSGPAGTDGVGICKAGTHTCNVMGTAYGACMGEVLPGTETCSTAEDDDCDGMVNESGTSCVCVPNSMEACYSGPMGTSGIGVCKAGTHTCNALGTAYGACMGEVLPGTETCNTPVDDDCDGMTNESGAGCVCLPNSTAPCYTGPMGTSGVGICKPGTQTCNAQGTMIGACTGQVTPQATENCTTPEDDNCNGQANEGCAPACTPSTNVILDGDFEQGPFGGTWNESSTNFGTPLCDVASCGMGGGTGPHAGTYWSWFGGISTYEEAAVDQTITVQGGTATLSFYLQVPVACDSPDDYMEVTVDGVQVFVVDGASSLCGVKSYSLQTVDLTAYADSVPHTIAFHSETFSTNLSSTNFFVDDIMLGNVCVP